MLYRAILGQVATSQAYFADVNGQALVAMSPATFIVRDHNRLIVIPQTAAAQSGMTPSLWTATFTLPLNAVVPSTANARYQIEWSMPLSSGATATAVERFDVIAPGDPVFNSRRTDVLHVVGLDLTDSLQLPAVPTATPIYSILDLAGNVVSGGATVTGPINNDSGPVYSVRVPVPRLKIQCHHGFQPYLARWDYTPVGGTPRYDYHAVYAIDNYIMAQIARLRSQVDRARMGRAHPDLDWSDADLAIYLMRGLDWLNGVGYIFTDFSLATVPHFAIDLLVDAATDKAWMAQGVAEIYHQFDFQGSPIQLNTEQIASSLEGLRQAISSQLNDRGIQFKKSLASGGYSLSGARVGDSGRLQSNRVAATMALRLGQSPASNIASIEGGWRNSYSYFAGGLAPFGGF